ncbi:NAD(P)/FAD-dependent oxidoreductase [Bradyrhizobium sp. CCGUVB23]|uniref:phytoene desaturase family protein n=1 Tax=Bradyrhizobium sp. CCGUVB23 TaxID=2949630 RepID=UPI0020B2A87D|nr:NAD(P)/FAD-dependent oxidoreductase [Bradyrhizobium sp. CCGUVB23]MCP3463331.1 NAD(P)/FAD-dependent oxidoreductase [Bradyrhizobium sp. CCGUVB23]
MSSPRVVVIGAGIAGLCTAVYARKCGYQVEVFEQHDSAGGLATSWRRGDYTFETCLHWFTGARPQGALNARWREVFDVERLVFVHPEEFARVETEHGDGLRIYSNVDRLEAELLRLAPEDAAEIRHLIATIRQLSDFPMPDPSESWPARGMAFLRVLPYMRLLHGWSGLSIRDYGERFRNGLLRGFFGSGEGAQLSMLALLFALAWMNEQNGAYAVGGSQAIIRLIREKLDELGGHLRLGAKVEKILVERDAVVGVQLAGGEIIKADWVISAADAHATIYELLGGKYVDELTERTFRTLTPFASYLQVSFGVARDLSAQPGFVTRILDAPLEVDPETTLSALSQRFFHFDPTFAPVGKTAVTCFLPTRNFAFWVDLHRNDPVRYQAEKHRVAEAVIAIVEKMVPDFRKAIETTDVSTPATVIRYTSNWQGSMEGWLLTPGMGFKPLRNTLLGLRRFLMAGQWIMPGGGLPSGLLTARLAVRALCKEDRIPFLPAPETLDHAA